jgi:hypothetical protein
MAVSYSTIAWAYKDPLTVQKMGQINDNLLACMRNKVMGCEMRTTGTSTVIVSPGFIELNGEWLSMTTTATLTAENAASWQTGSEAASTALYIVAYKTGTVNFDICFRASGPQYTNTTSGTAGVNIYDNATGSTWVRYLGLVPNDTASSFESGINNASEGDFGHVLGTWQQATTSSIMPATNTVYQATCDMYICSMGLGADSEYMYFATDGTTTPKNRAAQLGSAAGMGTVQGFVKRGHYWKLTDVTASNTSFMKISGGRV